MERSTYFARLLLTVCIVSLLAACGSRTIESDLGIKGAPDWVNQGSQALNDKGGRLFHGIGSAPEMNDDALQKAAADNRARAELASILSSYMDVVIQDYTATAGDGEQTFNEQALSRQVDSVTRINLGGARIIANWRNPDTGVIYSLAELDMQQVREVVNTAGEMDPGLRRHIRDHGDNLFDQVSRRN